MTRTSFAETITIDFKFRIEVINSFILNRWTQAAKSEGKMRAAITSCDDLSMIQPNLPR